MDYLLVENKQIVHLGPINWKPRLIQSELNDLEVSYTVPISDPNSYIKISDSLEIFPIESLLNPGHDELFECLSGPFWTFSNNVAIGHYNVIDADIDYCKQIIKQRLATKRYEKEIAGIKVAINGQEYTLETDRDTRNIFIQKYFLMSDTDECNWKFPEGWTYISKAVLGSIIAQGAVYIQQQFDWEENLISQINNTTTLEALKQLYIGIN